jgi:hypothetical protein
MKPTSITNIIAGGAGAILKDIFTKASFTLTPLKYSSSKGSLEEEKGPIFAMDALVQESEQRAISVTNYPIEGGGEFAEHAQQLAFTLNVSGIVSDASLSYVETFSLGGLGGTALGQIAGLESKTQKTYDLLTKWAETGQPLLVRTKFKRQGYYKQTKSGTNPVPFVIESFSHTRNKETGGAISISMSLREVRMVKLKSSAGFSLPFIGQVKPSADAKSPSGPVSNEKSATAAANNKSSVQSGYASQKAYLERVRK